MIYESKMTRRWVARTLIAFALAAAPVVTLCQTSSVSSKLSASDPYAPLRLYGGSWELKMAGANGSPSLHIENHCEKTGIFFVCEQIVDGKNQDLVVFLPTGTTGETQKYRTQNLLVTGEKPGDWSNLEISGDHWTYSSEDTEKDAKVYWRTTNLFSGPDKIHFEVQRSADGKNWEMKQSGDEYRASK